MLIPFNEIKFDEFRNVDALKGELRRVCVPTIIVNRPYSTLIPGAKPGQSHRGADRMLPDVIGVYSDSERTTTFVRGGSFWHVRMSVPLGEEHSRVLLEIYQSGRSLISQTPVLPYDTRGVAGVGSGNWIACSLEGLDALCALVDTHAPKLKKAPAIDIPKLVAANLLDTIGYVLHSS